MEIDLAELRAMHPRLPEDLALQLMERAALALQRNGHGSPVACRLDVEREASQAHLAWNAADLNDLEQHDRHRITEDGAEAVALALAHRHGAWRIVRRMQRAEFADWLLERVRAGRSDVAALEVSGVDRGGIAARMNEKLVQVSRSTDVDQRWAGVIGFEEPEAALWSTSEAGA